MLSLQESHEQGTVSRPIVSVLLPTYNRATYIGQAIKSVLDQSFSDFELIVLDDGSTDETREIVNTFKDARIQYVYQPNRGRSNARNKALQRSIGRYIAFLDSDDAYLPNKLEVQVRYLDHHHDVGMIYTSAFCIDENGDHLKDKYEATVSGNIYKDIAFFRPVTITLPTVMVRREVFEKVGNFDEEMNRFEDTDMWRRISKFYRIDALKEYTCLLRTHEGNHFVSQNPEHIVSALDYYAKKINCEDREISVRVRRKGLFQLYSYYGAAFHTMPHWHIYRNALLFSALQHWPWGFIRNLLFQLLRNLLFQLLFQLLRSLPYIILNRGYKMYSKIKPYTPSYVRRLLRLMFSR